MCELSSEVSVLSTILSRLAQVSCTGLRAPGWMLLLCTTPHTGEKGEVVTDWGWPGRSGLARLQASSSGRTDLEQTDVCCPWLHHVPWLWARYFTFWVLFPSIKMELYYLLVSVVRIKRCNLCKSLGRAVPFPTDLYPWSELSKGSNQLFWGALPLGRLIKLVSELAMCGLAGKPCWAAQSGSTLWPWRYAEWPAESPTPGRMGLSCGQFEKAQGFPRDIFF